MPYKPVGIDENGRFPPRVQASLVSQFVTKPVGIQNGQVPVWDSAQNAWIGVEGSTPTTIDGGGVTDS